MFRFSFTFSESPGIIFYKVQKKLSTVRNRSKRAIFGIFSATRHEGLPQAVERLRGGPSRRTAAPDLNFLQKSMKSFHTKAF